MVDFIVPASKLRRSDDGCVYGFTRKKYNSINCHVKHRPKCTPYKREHAAIIMLRKHGHRINHIAAIMFRSTSYIYKIVTKAKQYGSLPVIDQRKMVSQTRLTQSGSRWRSLCQWIIRWQPFIEGTEDKPP